MQFDTASQNKSVNIKCASSCRIIITSMRFPKQELDINQYLQVIDNLLKDEECHIFIDTNIISQLYKLNDAARTDFFTWVGTVANRFHIPNWTVHEYQKRYCSQKTEDYLTELNNKETVKKLENFSIFGKEIYEEVKRSATSNLCSSACLWNLIYCGHRLSYQVPDRYFLYGMWHDKGISVTATPGFCWSFSISPVIPNTSYRCSHISFQIPDFAKDC